MQKAAQSNADLERTFKMFDKDGDGFVTQDEIGELCNFLTPDKAKELIAESDASGDGKIDLNEWIAALGTGNAALKKQSTMPSN